MIRESAAPPIAWTAITESASPLKMHVTMLLNNGRKIFRARVKSGGSALRKLEGGAGPTRREPGQAAMVGL